MYFPNLKIKKKNYPWENKNNMPYDECNYAELD
jgi:hypothetical protein